MIDDEVAPTAAPGGLVDLLNAEAPAARQPGKVYECWLEGEPAPFTVRVANRELIAYEKAAARHREWPAPSSDRPELGRHFQMTYCTYAAARRAGRFTGTFDQWQEVLIDWEPVAEAPADPTQ